LSPLQTTVWKCYLFLSVAMLCSTLASTLD